MSYYPVNIQAQDADTEAWTDLLTLHAVKVNRAGGGESFAAGADQYHPTLTFTFRYCTALEAVAYSPQTHRMVYKGRLFNITDYDDYMEQHRTVRLTGVCYG